MDYKPRNICNLGLGLSLGLGGKQTSAAGGGGGGGFGWNEYLLLALDPAADAEKIYKTDADTTPVVDTGDDVVRAYPGLTPASGDYFADASSTYPTWLAAPDGINGNPCIKINSASHQMSTVSMVLNQVWGTDSACLVVAGRVNSFPTSAGNGRQMAGDLFNQTMMLGAKTASDIRVNWVNSGATVYQSAGAVGAGGVFTVVARKTGDTLSLWLNGTKQSDVTTAGTQNATVLDDEKFVLAGGPAAGTTEVRWDVGFVGAGAGTGLSDEDCQAMADELERRFRA